MRRTLLYALLFAVPAGTTLGSGLFLISGDVWLGAGLGTGLAVAVFLLVVLGRETGAVDEGRADGP